MCLILIAYRAHLAYPLVIAANRDESFARPAAPAHFWQDHPDVCAGRDLEQGGTWLGITTGGRFAAITNFRGVPKKDGQRSRGELTRSYLTSTDDPQAYLNAVRVRASEYNGFSVLVGDLQVLYFFSNQGNGVQQVTPGVHGLSNHLLDEPWPKVTNGAAALGDSLGASETDLAARLFELLANDDGTRNPVAITPKRDRESSTFIVGEQYGTRASTVLIVHANGEVFFAERSFGPLRSPLGTVMERFRLHAPAITPDRKQATR